MKRRLLGVLTALCLCAALLPTTALAGQITVKDYAGQLITLDTVETGDSIDSIKAKIADKTGLNSAEQTLLYNGKKLEDGRTLYDYGITSLKGLRLYLLQIAWTDVETAEELDRAVTSATSPTAIRLKNDITYRGILTISGTVTLDLNGCELKAEKGAVPSYRGVITVAEGGKLIICDNSDDDSGSVSFDSNFPIEIDGELILLSGTVKSAVRTNSKGTFTMNGGKVDTGDEQAIYNCGTMHANGGTVISTSNNEAGVYNAGTIDTEEKCDGTVFDCTAFNGTGGTIKGGIFTDTVDEANTVTFDSDGGDVSRQIRANAPATVPAEPVKPGCTFAGWYTQDGTKWNFDTVVTDNITLTAQWNAAVYAVAYYSVAVPLSPEHGTVTVSPKKASAGTTVTVTTAPDAGYTLETLTLTDENGREIDPNIVAIGERYTFKMPFSAVTVTATFMEDNTILNYFMDIAIDSDCYEAVLWAAENGVARGDGLFFRPNEPCTRGQIVTFLWRAEGSPEPRSLSGFTDVAATDYYAEAVARAVEEDITCGTGDGKFTPDAVCTRAQAVTLLYRALKGEAESKEAFVDVPSDAYYAEAVAWAAENGIAEGIGGGKFDPDGTCTRGQIVTFLWRAMAA